MAEGQDADAPHAGAAPAPAGSAEAGGAKAGGAKPGRRPRWVLPTAIVLVIGLVGALVFAVWFGIKVVQGFGVEQARSNAVSAAKDVATNFTTYDVGTVEADAKRLLGGTTPAYAGTFDGNKDAFLKRVHDGQVKSAGEVTEAGLLSYDPTTDTARVLVSVRAQISSKDAAGGEGRDYRLEITMVDRGDWLADRVEFVS